MVIRVGLVDDQPLVRAGFALLLGSQDDLTVSWQVDDGDQVPAQGPVDVVLMDVQMARVDGISATRELLARDEHVRVIMLTTFDDEDFVSGAIDAGASGFLLKDARPEELLDAVRVVHSGEAVLAPRVTARVLHRMRQPPDQPGMQRGGVDVLKELTVREREILTLIALGLNNEEIADREYVSMATVKTHVRHILMKTASRDRVQAVLTAFRSGLVTQDQLLSHPQG